jgi:CheY-like chemotaxis protein
MNFQSILVSRDDETASAVRRVLAEFDVDVARFSEPDAAQRSLAEGLCDLLVVDFADRENASALLQHARQVPLGQSPMTAALLASEDDVHAALAEGADFILYTPVSADQARSMLRAVAALLKRERRRNARVPVQMPIFLSWPGTSDVEGIVLDLSGDGMDVLAAQPVPDFADVSFHFTLPDEQGSISGRGSAAWSNPNGETGIRFTELADDARELLGSWLQGNGPGLPGETEVPMLPCKLSDLSLGACYVETESPFPLQTQVELCLRAASAEAHAEGIVRVMHPGCGMGIEFLSATSNQQKAVEDFIDVLVSRPGTVPELLVFPRELGGHGTATGHLFAHPSDAPEDPLLHLLRDERSLSRSQFLAELRKQRRGEPVDCSEPTLAD